MGEKPVEEKDSVPRAVCVLLIHSVPLAFLQIKVSDSSAGRGHPAPTSDSSSPDSSPPSQAGLERLLRFAARVLGLWRGREESLAKGAADGCGGQGAAVCPREPGLDAGPEERGAPGVTHGLWPLG